MNVPVFPKKVRRGIRDLWGAWMVLGAEWSPLDYPMFPLRTWASSIVPKALIPWPEAKAIHKKMMAKGVKDYHVDAFVHCFLDDGKFDGPLQGIWRRPKYFLEVLCHFDGVLGLDFSIEPCMPRPVWQHQLYKMRAMEYYMASNGVVTIQNARWCGPSTWDDVFDVLVEGGIFCVGTVASGLHRLENRYQFEAGLRELVRRKHPKALIVVGSANYPIFDELREAGVPIIQFDGETCTAFRAAKKKEVRHV